MKKYTFFKILMFLGVVQFNGVLGQDSANMSEIFHIVTFKVGNNSSPASLIDTGNLKTKLKNSKRPELENMKGKIGEKSVTLGTEIPENFKGQILFNVTGLICCCDKYTYPERGACAMHGLIKNDVLGEDSLGFSFCPPSHNRNTFYFGQEKDQKPIAYFLNELATKNPEAKIVVMGTCSGATGILNTLASDKLQEATKDRIKKIVFESPATSSNKVWKDMGNNYLPWGLKWLFPVLAWFWFGNCREERSEEKILNSYENIPKNASVLIAQLKNDPVTPLTSIQKIKEKLQENNRSVEIFEIDDKNVQHGFLATNKEYQQKMKEFLQKKKN